MDIDNFGAPRCQDTAGFLFKHACSRQAAYQCDLCGKAICSSHHIRVAAADLDQQGIVHGGKPGGDADVCTSCAQRTGGSVGSVQSVRRNSDSDPYWYSGHYGGYGSYASSGWGSSLVNTTGGSVHDPNDFTEADGENLQREGDASFEMEASGS